MHGQTLIKIFFLSFKMCLSNRIFLSLLEIVGNFIREFKTKGQEKKMDTRVITLCPYFPTVLCVSPVPITLRMSREIKGAVKNLSCGVRPITTILKHLKLVFALKLKILKIYWRFYCLVYIMFGSGQFKIF
jgi:hypothetical protein